ncbi:response regulator [Oceanispirochaeta sp.]|jgi:two-component system cell cycle sensor histidine kinase/response regulator CckA|uniref:hybrid sensor histidine kinase/response regulator n=1 Tax=Oceanispirochaeta sp. TaxID=2035350 RepID=UPI0026059898|nr:response regulator [Oceanispirochaeta sp.]MDA3958013.1 response regulator [Oceanispirochaeta sp.]
MSTKHFAYKENKELQRLSGGIAHDLNNTIMVIDGFSECLKKTSGLSEKQVRYIDQIKKATVQIDNLTNILITICERSILNMSYFNLKELIETFIKEKVNSEGFLHKIDLQSETAETSINFDRSRILTVLESLYQNSVYPNEESRHISYKIVGKSISEDDQIEGMPPGEYIILDICDDGPGIEEKDIADIFSPYFSTKPHGKGKGLGLTVCAGIVHQCGAYIETIRPLEKGCLFRIYFPDNSRKPAGDSDDIYAGKQVKTILLINDDKIIRELMKQSLITAGYSFYSTSSAEEGLSIIKTFPIDVLVTELLLPVSNGYELVHKLQKSRKNLNVIFLTNYSDNTNDLSKIENIRFLQKPIKPSMLIKEIQQITNEGRYSENPE